MGKIVITTNMSLDGVIKDPDGREGTELGGWFNTYGGADLQAWAKLEYQEAVDAAGLLLGRKSEHWFGSLWPTRTGDFADRLNGMPKYVVSSTLEKSDWSNTTVLKGDPVEEVTKLKEQVDGEILIYASYQLLRALIDADVVDEIRLVVFPVILGEGERLFGSTSSPKPITPLRVEKLGENLAFLTYQVGKAG
jgi:dihydrofolate reductase